MPGGLIQLVTTGVQDSPIIGNPEITFFKTVYKQHTQFSIYQNDRFIGKLGFNKESSKVIEKNGDLLYNLYFKLEIPYFQIIKQTSSTNNLLTPYNINELSVTYQNMNCLMFYVNNDNKWYLIPQVLFSLSNFIQIINNIDSTLIEKYVLPDYIRYTDYGQQVKYYQMINSSISPIINNLRLNSSYWEQLCLDYISTSTNLQLTNPIQTLKTTYNSIYLLIKNRMFNQYYEYNFIDKNIEYFNFQFNLKNNNTDAYGNIIKKTETERYFDYTNSLNLAIQNIDQFDIDIVYTYCKDNFLNFNDYINNILNNNSLCILLILETLYSNNNFIYTFWKKYNVVQFNEINLNSIVSDTNSITNWKNNFDNKMNIIFETNNIQNIIFTEYKFNYNLAEQNINSIFKNLHITDPKTLYIKLKTIIDRFTIIPNSQINFNEGYLATYYTGNIEQSYNSDNYTSSLNKTTNTYSTLKSTSTTLSETESENLRPVDMINIFSVVANDILTYEFDIVKTTNSLKSFIVLWRNVITLRLYNHYLDTHNQSSQVNDPNRKLAFYYSIDPSNLYFLSDFKQSFYEMFFKNSWIGNYSISDNDFIQFKDNFFKVEVNSFNTDFTNLITNNNFHNLNIVNTYNYIYYDQTEQVDNYNKINFKQVIYDNVNYILYLRYDNIYNSYTTIQLFINNVLIIPETITQQNKNNESNFNSFYLVLTKITSCPNLATIKLIVTYNNYIPALYFNTTTLTYPSSISNNLYLIKTVPNSIIYNSINTFDTNSFYIDLKYYKKYIVNNICILNISYIINNLLKPMNDFTCSSISNLDNNIDDGYHIYSISYFTNALESEVSESVIINCSSSIVQINNIPRSDNLNVIGRKIYRSYANQTKLYLLTTINNNTETSFNDSVKDINLGIEYNINGNIKYNNIPTISSNLTKKLVTLKETDISNNYYILNLDGTIYELPTDYSNILNIYIETLNLSYNLINNYNFTINFQGQITYENIKKDYLYYLVNQNNYLDYFKLIPSKQTIDFIFPFTLSTEITAQYNTLDIGYYNYAFSYYNSLVKTETNITTPLEISCNSNEFINIVINQVITTNQYDSYRIYRTKIQNSNSTDTNLYLLTTINKSSNTYTDIRYNPKNKFPPPPSIIFTANQIITEDPSDMTRYNNLTGTYRYIMTYVNSKQEESVPTKLAALYIYSDTNYINNQSTYMISNIILNLTISLITPNIIARNIYRTKKNTPDKYYLLTTINNNRTVNFFDNIQDENLTSLYINPHNDDILSNITNIPTDTFIFTFPFTLITTSTTNINTLDIGDYYYSISYYNSTSLVESTISNSIKISCKCNEYVTIRILQLITTNYYDSYRIYRTKIQNNSSTDTNLYLLTTISKSNVEYIDIRYNKNPSINYLPPAALSYSLSNVNNNSGQYNYIMTFYIGSLLIESQPVLSYLTIIYPNSNGIIINIATSPNNLVTSRKIYRTKSNSFDLYYLLDVIPNNSTTTYIDNISDSNLSVLYTNSYNNDNILGEIITTNYLNITSPINRELINKPTNFNLIETYNQNNLSGGTYQYIFTYYNPSTFKESMISNSVSITIQDNSAINIKLYYVNEQYIKIYRTNLNSDTFLYLTQIDLYLTTSYLDPLVTLSSSPLSYLSQNIIKPELKNISYKIIDLDFIQIISNNLSLLPNQLYKYKFSYYNSKTFEESLLSETLNVITYYSVGDDNYGILLYNDLFFNNYELPESYYIKIYRNNSSDLSTYNTINYMKDDNNYVLISTIPISSTTFRDSVIIDVMSTYNNDFSNYYLLEMPINEIVPNLDPFNSHSTDIDFINTKGLSDFNDFLFNKPFIMLTNNSNVTSFDNSFNLLSSFTNPMLFFYNISFKLNNSSVITLNNKQVVFSLPISTQQFFIKNSEDIYYTIENGIMVDSTSNVEQLTFNPSFDNFNTPINFLLSNNYYSSELIDRMIYIIDYILNQNSDYFTITNTIENINSIFVNLISSTLNTSNKIYGNMSKMILSSINKLNKLFNVFNNTFATLPIMTFSNNDYFNYSHDVLRYISDPTTLSSKAYDLVICSNKNNFKILSPVFSKYNSNNKISKNLYNYLFSVVTFYNNQLTYINNNIDYLNLTNPNSYEEKYISSLEIIQSINNNIYDYSGSNLITLLYPIIDNNIYQIIINDTVINSEHISNISNNTFTTTQYLENKIKDANYDSKNINDNKNNYSENKFNYLGIISIDSTNNIIYDDQYSTYKGDLRYIKAENDIIFTIRWDPKQSRYTMIGLSDRVLVNPVEIVDIVNNDTVFNVTKQVIPVSTQPDQQSTYLYIYEITFISIPDFNVGTGIVLFMNNLTFVCSLEQTNSLTYKIIIVTNAVFDFPNDKLVYMNDYSDHWLISPKITNINIIKQQNIKYSFQTDDATVSYLYDDNSTFIYGSIDKLYLKSDLYILENQKIYFNNYNGIINNVNDINITGFIHLENESEYEKNRDGGFHLYKKENGQYNTVILPPILTKNFYVYSYTLYNPNIQSIFTLPPTNYILLLDLNNHARYMLQLDKISLIPQGNYQTYTLSKNYLNLINYNVELRIDETGNVINIHDSYNLPIYSYYLVTSNNNSCIYYYETGSTMSSNGSSYFTITNTTINSISLIDNSLFDSNSKPLINSYLDFNLYDDFINTKLTINNNTSNFDTFDDLYYKSIYSNGLYQISDYNNNNFNYVNNDNQIMILFKNKDNITLHYPIVKSNINIIDKSHISITPYISGNLQSSVLVFDVNNLDYLNGNYITIGYIITTVGLENENDKFKTLSDSMVIIINPSLSNNMITVHQILLLVLYDTNNPQLVPFDVLPVYNSDNIIENNNLLRLLFWEIIGSRLDGSIYSIYLWTFFGSSTHIVWSNDGKIRYSPIDFGRAQDFYNNININISGKPLSQPLYITSDTIINISSNYNLVTSSPEIVKQNDNNLIIILNNETTSLNYKYFTDIRQADINKYKFNIYPLNFKSIENIKPILHSFIINNTDPTTIDLSSINSNAVYYVISYLSVKTNSQVIQIYFSHALNQINLNDPDISFLSIYYSMEHVIFITCSTVYTLVKINDQNYRMININKVFLEMNEIIFMEGFFFIVKGLNVHSNTYDLTIISYSSVIRNIRNEYNGYYSFGVYTSKNNNLIPTLDYQNLMILQNNINLNIGDLYLDNQSPNNLFIATANKVNINNYSTFTESTLHVSLFYVYDPNMEQFYLFDNFIKLKVLDKIVYNSTVYEILSIVDDRIYFNVPLVIKNIDLNNTFITFYLPYQPFEVISVIFDNDGNILSPILDNYQTLVINSDVSDMINMYIITNNKINFDTSSISGKPYLVRLWKTNYFSNFQNVMKLPTNNLKISDTVNVDYSIQVQTTYVNENTFSLVFYDNDGNINIDSLLDKFSFYYLQPVKINGTYNFIQNVIFNQNNIRITLTNNLNLIVDNTYNLIFSPYYHNLYNYYYYQKFNYNFSIQVNNYNSLIKANTFIEVIRYIIQNNKLILIQTNISNKKILFEYGKSISYNEYTNNITNPNGCLSVYFYNSYMINLDGTISNFDMSLGTYHLITLNNNSDNNQYVYLAKIIYPNKLYFYNNILSNVPSNYTFLIDKLMTLKINNFNNFTYSNTNIIQSRNLININEDKVKIIKQYEIIFIGIPLYTGSQYQQQIVFLSEIINLSLYNTIYFDTLFTNSYNIIYDNSKYYIVSNSIINNNFNFIYTVNTNYLVMTTINNTIKSDKKLDDPYLLNFINNNHNNNEFLVQDILLSKVNSNNNIYKYTIPNKLDLDSNESFYYANSSEYLVTNIDNIGYDTISTYNPIDNNELELSNENVHINLFIYNLLNMDIIINYDILFSNIKQLKCILIDNSKIEDISIYNFIKPWTNWSLLNGILKVNNLTNLVTLGYVQYENGNIKIITYPNTLSNISYSYLTNDEITILSSFLVSINKSIDVLNNYITMITIIEPTILNNLINWLNHVDFFINVTNNINDFLISLNVDAFFDGNNIIFKNDPTPETILIDGHYEISSYISQEFTYNSTSNLVYRSQNSYNNINSQIYNWINKIIDQNNKSFGINLNKLLRYLRVLGDDFNNLINNFSNVLQGAPEYLFNNPLKFIVNKVWENNYKTNSNLQKLNSNYSSSLEYSVTFENLNNRIVSSIEYFQNLSIIYTGLNSLNNYYMYTNSSSEKNLTNVSLYYPLLLSPVKTNIKLVISSLFSYMITLDSNELIPDSTFSFTFLNGENISTNVILNDITGIYSNQLNFYLDYNIKPDDFFIVKQQTIYTITVNTFLGFIYTVNFNNITNKYINDIKFNNTLLTIIYFNDTSMTISSTEQIENISNYQTIPYELITYVGIKNITVSSLGQELDFYSESFNFIKDSTLLRNETQTYILNYSDSTYYIIGEPLINKNISIITFYNVTNFNILNQIIYQYTLDPSFNETKYVPINNNNLPALEFKLVNPETQSSITPLQINSLGNNQILIYYTSSMYSTITNNFSSIYHNKHLNENLINKIVKITPSQEYLYYFNFIIPASINTIIYIYDTMDDISSFEPTDTINKTSIYFNQTTNQTNFTIENSYTLVQLTDNIRFIQKNTWGITDYTINNTTLIFQVPSDFVLNTSSSYEYKINDYIIDKTTLIFEDGLIIIQYNGTTLVGTLEFKQYYIEVSFNTLVIPNLNQTCMIQYEYPYQYLSSEKFYIIPYTNTGDEYDQYLYLLKTNILTTNEGYIGQTSKRSITLNNLLNIEYNGYIVMEYDYSNYVYYLISLKEIIDVNSIYEYTLEDKIFLPVIEINTYQDSLEFGQFYYQESLTTVYLFMRNIINPYSINYTVNTSNFYIISYNEYTIINLYNENKFVQNTQMTRTTQTTTTSSKTNEDPIFNDYSKFFKSYSLYLNDQLAEEINENVININKYLYCTENQRKQLENMTKIRFNGNSWELYMPLIFWFCNKPGLSIPSVAMPYTDLILKYQLNNLETVLSNDLSGKYSLTQVPEVKITLITDFILLDMIERTLFGTYSHEYIINRYKIYPNIFVNSELINAHRVFTHGLIKDIYLISKPLNSNLTYYPQEIPKYDYKYGKYVTALQYYNLFIINNVYTSQDQISYALDIEIIINNTKELNIYNATGYGPRIKLLLAHFDSSLLYYFMYYEDKYLSKLSSEQQINILTIYLTYQFSNKVSINEISPLQSLSIRVNGAEIFSARDDRYYNAVVPYTKFKNSLPTGYYAYSFSLHPSDDQPSGHLNFTYFDDITFVINSDPNVNNNPYLLENVIKEYNILRVMSGIGSLAWIS